MPFPYCMLNNTNDVLAGQTDMHQIAELCNTPPTNLLLADTEHSLQQTGDSSVPQHSGLGQTVSTVTPALIRANHLASQPTNFATYKTCQRIHAG